MRLPARLPRDVRVWLLVGLAVREVFSFWTGHPYDLEVWIRNAVTVSAGGTPYAYLPPVPGLSFAYTDRSLPSVGYLPFWSLLLAGLYRAFAVVPGASRYLLYFLLKQPPILADVGLGYLLFRSARRWGGMEDQAFALVRSWMLFPYAIVISAVWGQFDAMVMDLVLFALLVRRAEGRGGLLGLGIALKWFPVVLLPYLLLRERRWRKASVAAALLLPALLTGVAIAVMGWDLGGVSAMSTFAAHGGGGGMTYGGLLEDPPLAEIWQAMPALYSILGFLWIPACVAAGFLAQRRFPEDTPAAAVQGLIVVTGAFLLTRFAIYEQYLLYLFPLLLLDVVLWHPERRGLVRWIALLAYGYLLANNDLMIRFLGPVSGSFVDAAYAADVSGWLSVARVFCLGVLEILITLSFVQMVLVVAGRATGLRPWPEILVGRVRARLAGAAGPSDTGP